MDGWWELRLLGVPRGDVDLCSARLFELGAAGLQEDWLPGTAPPPRQPWDTGPPAPLPDKVLLRAWFEDPDQETLDAELADVPAERRWEPVADVDWEAAWRDSFQPIRISDRLTVAPPWDAPEGAVIVEPGQGFGSGAHPTTRQALVAVDRLADDHQRALDVGCGSGVLALAAAKLGLDATGVDIDEPGIREARENARRSGLTAHFSTDLVGDLEGDWDLVLANLHAELIVALADDLLARTADRLVLAGILEDREPLVRARLDPVLDLEDRTVDGPWVSLVYRVRT